MRSIKAKTIIHWAGSGLSILAIIFVVVKLTEYAGEIDLSLFVSVAVPLVCLSVVYGLASTLLAFAWRDLLKHFEVSVDSLVAMRIYGVSQLAKYVPGNIFHFVGRQALGLEVGLPAWPLGKSAIWEVAGLAISGSLFIVMLLPYFYGEIPVILTLVLFGMLVLTTAWIASRWFSIWIAQAVGWYTVFLVMSGLVFLTLLSLIAPAESISGFLAVLVCGAYVIAWLVGLVTPGAPAGVGIRELVLFALLHPFVSEADLLATIVFGRMVTVAGDLLFYLSALTIKSRLATQ